MKNSFNLLVILVLASCTPTKKIPDTMTFAANPVIAHRGAFKKNSFPENSLAGLREAIRLQCTGSEFDVRMTADDTLIINHDPHHQGKDIETTAYAQLRMLPLSNGEALPTLREYLLAGMKENRHTRLILEIKPSTISKERGQLIAERTVKLVKELKADPLIVYISFDYDILKKVIELNPGAQAQYLSGDRSPAALKADNITGADYHFSVFKQNPAWIEEAQKNRIVLNAWTVNEKEDMQWLLSKGFDFITTNEPELLLALWKERKPSRD